MIHISNKSKDIFIVLLLMLLGWFMYMQQSLRSDLIEMRFRKLEIQIQYEKTLQTSIKRAIDSITLFDQKIIYFIDSLKLYNENNPIELPPIGFDYESWARERYK